MEKNCHSWEKCILLLITEIQFVIVDVWKYIVRHSAKGRYLMQRARTVIGLFGVTLNLKISKIIYRQNSVTLDGNCKFWSPISDCFKGGIPPP